MNNHKILIFKNKINNFHKNQIKKLLIKTSNQVNLINHKKEKL